MRWMIFAAIAATIAASPALAQDKPRTAQFTAGTLQFEITLPEGYCVTDGMQVASGKPDLQLERCDEPGRVHDFYMIKMSPNIDGGTGPTTRAALFAAMKPLYDSPEAAETFAAMSDRALRDRNLDMEGGWKPMGIDDVCAYMGAQVAADGIKLVQGICVTVIGGRTFAIYSTGHGGTVADLARQIQTVRKLAQSMRPVSPK